jgi:hypothetical protein
MLFADAMLSAGAMLFADAALSFASASSGTKFCTSWIAVGSIITLY